MRMLRERVNQPNLNLHHDSKFPSSRPSVIKPVNLQNTYNIPTHNSYSILAEPEYEHSDIIQVDGNSSLLESDLSLNTEN